MYCSTYIGRQELLPARVGLQLLLRAVLFAAKEQKTSRGGRSRAILASIRDKRKKKTRCHLGFHEGVAGLTEKGSMMAQVDDFYSIIATAYARIGGVRNARKYGELAVEKL